MKKGNDIWHFSFWVTCELPGDMLITVWGDMMEVSAGQASADFQSESPQHDQKVKKWRKLSTGKAYKQTVRIKYIM